MNIECAIPIPGWMEPHDLIWLASHAAHSRRIVEVGCWKGRSTTVLAENSPSDAIIFAVDTWLGSAEHDPPVAGLYEDFLANMRPHIRSGKVLPFRMPSVEAAQEFTTFNQPFDFVFIDAAHDYDSIRADILAWRPLVAPGGLLCGHDGGHPPIVRALEELLPERLPNECSMWQVRL